MVFPSENHLRFEIIDPNDIKSVKMLTFNYQTLIQKGKNAKTVMLVNRKIKAVVNLKVATTILIMIVGTILLLDICKIIEIDEHRLYLLLMMIILALLPYYETIKFANFELTQKDDDKYNNVK